MATNRRLAKLKGPDFYVTPAWGTRALIDHEEFEGRILEPCCGDGAMAEVLKETGNRVIASDLYDLGYGKVEDFLKIERRQRNIVTNPPFNIAEAVIDHALSIADGKVCFLLRSAFIEGQGRWHRIYNERPPTRILVFSSRLSIYPASDNRQGGGTTSYAWFIWDMMDVKRSDPKRTELVWIPPRRR